MSGPKECDDQEGFKLDEDFKDILERVRPHNHGLTAAEKQLFQIWLDKLTRASSQRVLRNQYLIELCRHLKSGHIGGIFCAPPQNGPLVPLQRLCNRKPEETTSASELSETSSVEPHNCRREFITRCRSKTPSSRRSTGSASSINCGRAKFQRTESAEFRRKIDGMTEIIEKLQIQNERLKRDLSHKRNNCGYENYDDSRSAINQLTGEVAALRNKLAEMKTAKDLSERNHRDIVQQYKIKTAEEFNELKQRLRDAESKNEELNAAITSTNGQLEKIIRERDEQVTAIERTSKEQLENAEFNCKTLLDEKDKELLKQDKIIRDKVAEIAEMDRKRREEVETLSNNIYELEEKLRMKIEDALVREEKLRLFIKEQCGTVKEDFTKMRTDMEHKISALQRVILRLDKSKKKLGIDCAMKISQVLETKELEIKSLQLQLQEQRAELASSLSTEKQSELNKLAENLEERYKELLSATDANAGNVRKHLLARINLLENQITVLKRSLEFDDESTVV